MEELVNNDLVEDLTEVFEEHADDFLKTSMIRLMGFS